MVSFAPTPSQALTPHPNFNKAAFMAARPDISNAGFDFDTWYQLAGQNETPTQFQPYIEQTQAVPGSIGGGVVPMTVEPLHQFEKSGLTALGQPERRPELEQVSKYLADMMRNQQTVSPEALQYMDEAAQMFRQSARPVTMQEAQDVANPYADVLQERLTQQGERARQKILARQGTRGASSFGDTSSGTEMGFLQEELQRGRGDIDFKTYESALSRIAGDRGRVNQAGQGLGNLGTGRQNITTSGIGAGVNLADALFGAGTGITDLQRHEASDQITAGRDIRGYNQGILDLISGDIIGRQQFEPAQIAQIQSLLDIFKSGVGTSQTPGVNTLQQIGGGLTALSPFAGELAKQYGGSSSSGVYLDDLDLY